MNDTPPDPGARSGAPLPGRPSRAWRWIANSVLSLLVVAAGIAGAAYIKNTAPKAKKRPPVPFTPLVETVRLEPSAQRVRIPAMGTVTPSREVALKPRVSGPVARLHPEFVDGGVVAGGDVLVALDDVDYRLEVAKRESAVVDAQYRLQLELGHQDVARREWELLNDGKPVAEEDVSLALRKPHLAKARADLAAAEAQLAQARLDLARTVIRAPFNGIVRNKRVDVGAQVGPQDTLADIVGTDTYWVEAHVRVDHLQWISIPGSGGTRGAAAFVRYRGGHVREGRVIRLLKDLDPDGRMARLVVAVDDPVTHAGAKRDLPPLLIGEYVHVDIEGKALADVYRIPRLALRDNEFIWVVGEDGILDVRQVTPVWRGPEAVLIRDGIRPGERLVVSALANPVPGMRLSTRAAQGADGREKPSDAS